MLDQYLNEIVKQKMIPGAVVIVQKGSNRLFYNSYGSYVGKDEKNYAITLNTLFDVASLTKVVATLPAILLLISKKQLKLEDAVSKFIPEFTFADITIQHLLQHSSGLPASLYPKVLRYHQRDIFKEIYSLKLEYKTGSKVLYSDIGMILLGKIIEIISGKPMNQFVEEQIFQPWQMKRTRFVIPSSRYKEVAATEYVNGQYIHGEVHDEKAFLLGGVSGSAGLFSSAEDLAIFAEYWLQIEKQLVLPFEWMDLSYKETFLNRGLGFEVSKRNEPLISYAGGWPEGSFGHTGFTGTSLWMDPSKKVFVVLLTNAVHFGRETKMREIRQRVHTIVHEEMTM